MEHLPLPFRESRSNLRPAVQVQEAAGPPEIPLDEISFDPIKDFLGEGAFGKVYRGKCRGKDVAVKVPSKQDLTEEELQDFRHEVQIMRKIFHPNVVLFLGASTEDKNLMIVTELMETDLEKLLQSNKELTYIDKLGLAKDAALGINWLHGINSIVHRDLKPANLLVDKNRVVKVTDFGFSQLKPADKHLKDMFGPRGTALYMSPEVMQQKPFNERADVYSFGLILYEILTGKSLFPEFEEWTEFCEAICSGVRPPIPSDCLPSVAYLMKKCWDPNPAERPSIKEVVFRLDEITIDYYFQEGEGKRYTKEGSEFCKKNFLLPTQSLQDNIPWLDFVQLLKEQLPGADFETVKPLFVVKPKGTLPLLTDESVVPIERVAQIIQWFGPFFLPELCTAILGEMNSLMEKVWFHGDITKDLAEKRLYKRESGTFLIRLSTTSPLFPYTISKISGQVFQHKRIKLIPERNVLSVPVKGENKEFKNILELVECPGLGLSIPCPQDTVDYNPYNDE